MADDNILSHARLRYFKWALLLVAVSVLWYALDEPRFGPGGGTVLGYTLGSLGALLIVWLLWFGVRKRQYRGGIGTVRGWLSAHVYLGLSLLVVATLHTGFQFGWNVHTLAYGLMVAVIASGLWGVAVYLRNPGLMSDLLDGRTLEQHAASLAEIDGQSRQLAARIAPRFVELVEASAATPIARPGWGRLRRRLPGCATAAAVAALRADERASEREVRDLFALQFRRLQVLERLRAYLRLRAWTEAWLVVHVPLSLALLGALLAHILAVFTYW
ncbi:hypothetical protein [Silanimonas lenta]|uniref:hypothetical protein n=1 Tax=Silanimonas lenta TaxID=265429 RepID=UPI002FE2C543